MKWIFLVLLMIPVMIFEAFIICDIAKSARSSNRKNRQTVYKNNIRVRSRSKSRKLTTVK